MGDARPAHANGQAANAALPSRLGRVWSAIGRGLAAVAGRRGPIDAVPAETEVRPAQSGWVPFDEQRRSTEFRRADVVFGPDMFDPRTDNGDRPLTRAMREKRSAVDPDDLDKTVGEVFGRDASPAEIREKVLENARSIELESGSQP